MAKTIRTLTLSEAQRAELIRFRDSDAHIYIRERCAALLKIADGRTAHWVARNGLLRPRDPDTVYAWLAVYEAAGMEGLLKRTQGRNRRGHL